jgi:hypothetical protein
MVVELVVGNVILDLSANIAVCTYVMMKICSKTTGLDSRNIHRDCSSHIREHLASPEELPEELMGVDDANNNDETMECVCCQWEATAGHRTACGVNRVLQTHELVL